MTEKEEHLDIREKLRNMPSVKASDDFVMKLQKRINLAEAQPSTQIHKQHQEKLEGGFFAKLFGGRNAWLVPAMGVTAVVFLVFIWVFVINQNNMTSSGDKNTQTITKTEQQEDNDQTPTSSSDEDTNVGETLKTELPGREITQTFGFTDSRSEIDKGDLEGGISDDKIDDLTTKPEVKMVEPERKVTIDREESPSSTIDARGTRGVDEKSKETDKTMETGVLKKSAVPPMKTKDSLGNNNESNVKAEQEKRAARNFIDQTELENLREKVNEEK